MNSADARMKEYWWSYNFQRSNLYHDGKTTDAYSRGMADTPKANELYLNVLFELNSGENLLLFETLEAWETTPNWPYRDQALQNFKIQIKCFSLKKLIQDLEVT